MSLQANIEKLPLSIQAIILKEIQTDQTFIPYIRNLLESKDPEFAVFVAMQLAEKRFREGSPDPNWKYLNYIFSQTLSRNSVRFSGLGQTESIADFAREGINLTRELVGEEQKKSELEKKAKYYMAQAKEYPYGGYNMPQGEAYAWAQTVLDNKIQLTPNYIEHWIMNEKHPNPHHKYIDAGQDVPKGYLYTGNIQWDVGRMVVYQDEAVRKAGGTGTTTKQIFSTTDFSRMQKAAKNREEIIDKFRKQYKIDKDKEAKEINENKGFITSQLDKLSPGLAKSLGIQDIAKEKAKVATTANKAATTATAQGNKEAAKATTGKIPTGALIAGGAALALVLAKLL